MADTRTTIRDLPTELFHRILDCLDCDGQDTLLACTLVCHDWLEISRAHLFSELHVLRGKCQSFEDCAQFFEAHPDIAVCIRTLSLEARLFSITPQSSLMPSMPTNLLCRILRAVPHLHQVRLRQLKIELSPSQPDSVEWPKVEHMEYEDCCSELATLFHLLSMLHVEHLDLAPLFTDPECSDVVLPDIPKLDLRSLCLESSATQPITLFKALKQTLSPHSLKSLRYDYNWSEELPGDMPVSAFLRELGQNIVDLNLCFVFPESYAVLGELPALRVFRYHFSAPLLASAANIAQGRALVESFRDRCIPHLPTDLEELALYIPYGDAHPPGPEHMPYWGLEDSLARLGGLRRLTIYFPTIPDTLSSAAAVAAICFPKSHSKGILEASVREWELECHEWDLYAYLRDQC